jgi:ABC-type branched-subunit amino acid transport system substrate-binding protein
MIHNTDNLILIGAIVPLTNPGWIEAGRNLLAGLEIGVSELNNKGGINGRPIELLVRDSAANPEKATDLVDELKGLGVIAIVGEYHSFVAKAIAKRADEQNVPFLCTSAVIDNLIEKPSKWIARLPQAQSKGWKAYAEFLINNKHTNIALATSPSVYWKAGTHILREHFNKQGGSIIEFDTQRITPTDLCDKLNSSNATALLLLVGYPNPAVSLVKAVRNDSRFEKLLIGAPAGQPEFNSWMTQLKENGSAIPFLRYMPEKLNSLGLYVLDKVRQNLREEPSFVALEGYDAIHLLAKIIDLYGADRNSISESWSLVTLNGTRGEIKLSKKSKMNLWQWQEAPIQVVDRDPLNKNQFRVLYMK